MLNQRTRELQHLYVGSGIYYRTRVVLIRVKWNKSRVVMEMLPYDQFVDRIDGSRKLNRRNWRFLKLYNPMSTSIDTKAFHGSCGNLPNPTGGSVDHECPDSLDDVGEHSNSANTGEPSEVKKSTLLFLWSQQK